MPENVSNEQIQLQLTEIRQAVSKMAEALTRLAVLEEKHTGIHELLRRLAERQEEEERRRHEQEVEQARTADIPQRVANLENVIREMHLERAKDQASLTAYQRSAKLVWSVVSFISGSGLLLGAFQLWSRLSGG